MFTAFRRFFGLLVCALALVACAPEVVVRPLTAPQIERAREGNLALVLLQIETIVDGKPVSPIGGGDSNRSVRLYTARMDTGATPARIVPAALSEQSAAAGWRYLLLEPGRYFVLLLPPGVEQNPPAVAYHAPSGKFGRLTHYRFEPGRGGFWIPELMAYVLTGAAPEDFRELTGYWLDVPSGHRVVYAGSLRVTCTNGRGLGGLIDSCTDFERRDDPTAAQGVAESVASLGAAHPAPLVAYGKPIGTVDARSAGVPTISMVPWKALGVTYPGAQLAPWGLVHGTERPVLVFNLLAITAHVLGQAAAGKEAEALAEASRACIERLSAELTSVDGEARLRHALRAAFPRAPASDRPEQSRLYAAPVLLRLRESARREDLALELGLHVRLETSAAPGTVYESRIVYAEPFPREHPFDRSTRLYERRTAQTPTAYPLARWCGPEGSTLLRQEIDAGLAAIARHLAQDLR